MTARDVGGIACKIFALYLATFALRGVGVVLSTIQLAMQGMEPASAFGAPPIWQMALNVGLFAVAAAMAWAGTKNFWPSDNPVVGEPLMKPTDWVRIGALMLGVFFALNAVPPVLLALRNASKLTSISVSSYNVFESGFQLVAAVGLILYGMKVITELQKGVEAQ